MDDERGRVLICQDAENLGVLSADTLATLSEIHCGGRIFDFAIDHTTNRVFIAWESASDDQYLTTFDIASGAQTQQVEVSSGVVANVQIALDERTKEVAVALSRYNRGGYSTSLFGCDYAERMNCNFAVNVGQVAQIAILGRQVLLASGLLANDPHVCITNVNLMSKEISHEYCAPKTGIHFAVGIVAGDYVVGYSGVQKWLAWKEVNLSVTSSVSMWRYEGKETVETIQQEVPASFCEGARIAVSRDGPRFLLYSETSNIAYVYSVGKLVEKSGSN